MKTAVLLHGTGGSDKDYFWFADTAKFLEEHGYKIWWPLLPNTDQPVFEETLNFVEQIMPPLDKETIFIGHSSACPLILSMLQDVKVKIKQVVLVAGYYESVDDQATSLLQKDEFNWSAIRAAA